MKQVPRSERSRRGAESREIRDGRRRLLRYLAASPALASVTLPEIVEGALRGQSTVDYAGLGDEVIDSPDRAINVFDFERVAERDLPPAHWGYLATGTDGDETVRANREGFQQFQLRPRRLVDVREVDTSVTVFGKTWPTPIVIAPTGHNRAFHSEGEFAVARAARAKNHLQLLSTVASSGVEDVNEARGEPVWYQLYSRYSPEVTAALVKRVEAAGCPAVVFTVDLQGGSNRETAKRFAKLDDRDCSVCHVGPRDTEGYFRTKPMFDGLDMPERTDYGRGHTWESVRELRESTSMKVLIKGIVTAEDARLAVDNGVDGIIVSNHGGRAEASGRSTIECLPEVVEAVQGRIVVLVDSGFRRGADFFKALAIGADAVCIGRPYLWGLASFGQEGVEAVLEILRRELEIVMRQMGTTSVAEIGASHIARRPW
jgi:isopentenyl diphosphate isomerase/L-lactate dehydrogenase-like FMN-dependent dehydrogenase